MKFATKAENLLNLAQLGLDNAQILPVHIIQYSDFIHHKFDCNWAQGKKWIVRSSAMDEDKGGQSQAGAYLSIADCDYKDLPQAIKRVFQS